MRTAYGYGYGTGLAVQYIARNPLALWGADLIHWIRNDAADITQSGTVSQWNDKTSGALNYTQGTAANRLTYLATGSPNGKPACQVVDSTDTMSCSLNLPAPGTTPTTIIAVMRQDSNTAGRRVLSNGLSSGTLTIEQVGPNVIRMNSGSNGPAVAAVLGTWGRMVAHFSNNTSSGGGGIPVGDWLRFGSAANQSSNINAGNTASTTRSIAAGGSVAALCTWAELMYIRRAITFAELTENAAYITAFHGSGLV